MRGGPLPDVRISDSMRALLLMEEALYPVKINNPNPVSVRHEKIPEELSWLKGMKYPDIPVYFDKTVVYYLKYFKNTAGGRATIKDWIEKSYRYRDMIKTIIKREKLPEILLYIAMIESGYEKTTRSWAGATGLWQIMKSGSKIYGLELNFWIDQRYNPELSTLAVVDYFRDLYYRFKDWHLALAAYNCGYGRMLQSMRRYNTNSFWKLKKYENALPRETRLYIPKLLAVAIADLNRDKFNLGKLNCVTPYNFREIYLPGGVHLSRVASVTGYSLKKLQFLNREYTRKRLPPGNKAYPVRLPVDKKTETAIKLLRKYRAWGNYRKYVVQFGDSVQSISSSFGVSISKIKKLNNLDINEPLKAGVNLILPENSSRKTVSVKDIPNVNVPSKIDAPHGLKRYFYRTSSGDTVKAVSKGLGVSTENLLKWNFLLPDVPLTKNMYLQVFLNKKTVPSLLEEHDVKMRVIDSDQFHSHYLKKIKKVRITYRVRKGDTLKSIAKRFKSRISYIRSVNHSSLRKIKSGDIIIVYSDIKRATGYTSKKAKKNPDKKQKPSVNTEKNIQIKKELNTTIPFNKKTGSGEKKNIRYPSE
ncbi:MAG: LysM peptidoglycan-binding domain-containing protein [Deltaproteobacteria bacterium]|nr:LysM peptidoglycan-binding domain-containing protein [Deltaproteobacteria bacterium]